MAERLCGTFALLKAKSLCHKVGLPNLSLKMYPLNSLTDKHASLKLLLTKTLSKVTKIH